MLEMVHLFGYVLNPAGGTRRAARVISIFLVLVDLNVRNTRVSNEKQSVPPATHHCQTRVTALTTSTLLHIHVNIRARENPMKKKYFSFIRYCNS